MTGFGLSGGLCSPVLMAIEPIWSLKMITIEVHAFGHRWFDTVGRRGPAEDQAAFFLDKHVRIYILRNGVTFGLEEHHKLQAQWINERHEFGHFSPMPLSASPERVRAVGTVYWQAEFRGRPAPNVIKAVVGEDWIFERRNRASSPSFST
jgi:hypothetical protein